MLTTLGLRLLPDTNRGLWSQMDAITYFTFVASSLIKDIQTSCLHTQCSANWTIRNGLSRFNLGNYLVRINTKIHFFKYKIFFARSGLHWGFSYFKSHFFSTGVCAEHTSSFILRHHYLLWKIHRFLVSSGSYVVMVLIVFLFSSIVCFDFCRKIFYSCFGLFMCYFLCSDNVTVWSNNKHLF